MALRGRSEIMSAQLQDIFVEFQTVNYTKCFRQWCSQLSYCIKSQGVWQSLHVFLQINKFSLKFVWSHYTFAAVIIDNCTTILFGGQTSQLSHVKSNTCYVYKTLDFRLSWSTWLPKKIVVQLSYTFVKYIQNCIQTNMKTGAGHTVW